MNGDEIVSATERIECGGASAELVRPIGRIEGRALRVGLTGGIGSGKSTVAQALRDAGAILADADVIAREVVEPGGVGLTALVDAFGDSILTASGDVDRGRLAALVFADDDARRTLESIAHPLIAAKAEEILASAPADGLAVYDVPLLVEAGLADQFDAVIIVDAPIDVRLERLKGRGMSRQDALARINAQASNEQRRAVCTIWIMNTGSIDECRRLVAMLVTTWLTPASAQHQAYGE